jgi:alkylation response protein AidB-like acyl-CoA dehydrogenase
VTDYPNHPAIAQKLLEQQAEINAARAAIARVRALHAPDPRGRSGFHPDDDDTPGSYGRIASACQECGSSDLAVRWPCPTIQALDGAPELEEAAALAAVHDAVNEWKGEQ